MMTNAERFKSIFGLYATEVWAMSENNFLKWLNAKAIEAEPVYCDALEDEHEYVGKKLDLVEVVRCKDCKWYTPYRNIKGEEMGEGECEGFNPCVPADHYCSRGKRKDEVEE